MHARLEDHAAQRFDAVADRAGGRSALLRRLIMYAFDAGKEEMAGPVRRQERATRRVEIRLPKLRWRLPGQARRKTSGCRGKSPTFWQRCRRWINIPNGIFTHIIL